MQTKKRSESDSKRCVIAVNEALHSRLKAKAEREGRVMQKMVEEKLEELVRDEQLELAEVAP